MIIVHRNVWCLLIPWSTTHNKCQHNYESELDANYKGRYCVVDVESDRANKTLYLITLITNSAYKLAANRTVIDSGTLL